MDIVVTTAMDKGGYEKLVPYITEGRTVAFTGSSGVGKSTLIKGAAMWAVSEPNMMNVAATRAKKEFYIIGDKKMYLDICSDVVSDTYKVIARYKKDHPDLVDDDVDAVSYTVQAPNGVPYTDMRKPADDTEDRLQGKIRYIGSGRLTKYAYVLGDDKKQYTITEQIYMETENADAVIKKDKCVTFIPVEEARVCWQQGSDLCDSVQKQLWRAAFC